jgi:hypothetical protein
VTHDCPATGCPERVGHEMLMCPRHWYMVPGVIRSAVWKAWDDGAGAYTEQHAAAVEAAIRSVNEKLAR